MSEVTNSKSWREELASLMEDTGIRYSSSDEIGIAAEAVEKKTLSDFIGSDGLEGGAAEAESVKEHIKEFLKASAEMLLELSRGCRDIVQQSLGNEDSFIVRKFREPVNKVSGRLKFLNEFLPEDRDPVLAWPVVLLVFIIALSALNVSTEQGSLVRPIKKVLIHPPSSIRIQLPDGRYMAYHEQGVPAEKARFTLIALHSFLSSRLAGLPGVKASLLEEFGVRLLTFDLPGFGESDPHPNRDLNSSALDMLYMANTIGVSDKFWIMGHSGGGMHAWAALRYIPERLAGAAFFAPAINPYESSMTKEERHETWEKWMPRRKLMYFLARRFPILLSYFYRQSFLSGKHSQLDKCLSLSLGEKDRALMEDPLFEAFWHRDVEESVRQGSSKPFVEETMLQVSHWGFSLADLQVQKKRQGRGILSWLKSIYGQAETERAGFLGPIYIWQGMDDTVVPPSMTNFVSRVLPGVTVHKLPGEGHFSYFYLCDECHRQIFSTLFGTPQGPLNITIEANKTSCEEEMEDRENTSLVYSTTN